VTFFQAAKICSDLNGTLRKRTPVASKMAFASAANTGAAVASAAPTALTLGRSINSMSVRFAKPQAKTFVNRPAPCALGH